jgi:hypothetical protein
MEFIMQGVLKLFTHIQTKDIPEAAQNCGRYYKRLGLVTHYGVSLHDNHKFYVEEFKRLNPDFAEAQINYELIIRKIG